MGSEKQGTASADYDTDEYTQSLIVTDILMYPIYRPAIRELHLPLGSKGLDAGCGLGLQTLLLAEAIGYNGHVIGLDISPEFLKYGREMIDNAGKSDRISFQEGSITSLPFSDDTFDWLWSANCAGYGPFEPYSLLKELARVVKPGGIVAIIAWSSEKLLPGYPFLEAKLSATTSGIAPFTKGKNPEAHFHRALDWFYEAGLEEVTASTFVSTIQAPLSDDMRSAMVALLKMRWPGVEPELTPEDKKEYQRLCLPESPDFILNLPDYYGFYTCSMFSGKVVG